MSFASDLAKFHQKTQNRMIKVLRMSCFDLFGAIVLDTPVDKGVLRNNWYVEFNLPSTDTNNKGDTVGSATLRRIESKLKDVDLTDIVYFSNNLDYAEYIEFDGISGKAPEGMVRVNTIRWDQIVSINVRRAK